MGVLISWVRDGCGHGNTSFPITRGDKVVQEKQAPAGKTYVVCLNCGKEIPYSWDQMKVVGS